MTWYKIKNVLLFNHLIFPMNNNKLILLWIFRERWNGFSWCECPNFLSHLRAICHLPPIIIFLAAFTRTFLCHLLCRVAGEVGARLAERRGGPDWVLLATTRVSWLAAVAGAVQDCWLLGLARYRGCHSRAGSQRSRPQLDQCRKFAITFQLPLKTLNLNHLAYTYCIISEADIIWSSGPSQPIMS